MNFIILLYDFDIVLIPAYIPGPVDVLARPLEVSSGYYSTLVSSTYCTSPISHAYS